MDLGRRHTKKRILMEISAALLLTLTMLIPFALADPAHCKVTGGGWIIPCGEADKATFGFNAQQYSSGVVKGDLEYIDHNTGMNVHGYEITWVSVYDGFTKADFGGKCKVNGVNGFTFRVYVEDNGEPGTADVFWITVSNGYDSGSQVLGGGNIQIHPPPPPFA